MESRSLRAPRSPSVSRAQPRAGPRSVAWQVVAPSKDAPNDMPTLPESRDLRYRTDLWSPAMKTLVEPGRSRRGHVGEVGRRVRLAAGLIWQALVASCWIRA